MKREREKWREKESERKNIKQTIRGGRWYVERSCGKLKESQLARYNLAKSPEQGGGWVFSSKLYGGQLETLRI